MKYRIVSIIAIFTVIVSMLCNFCYAEIENKEVNIKDETSMEEIIDTGLLKKDAIMKVPNQVETIASGDDEWTNMNNAKWEITKDKKEVTFTLTDFEKNDRHFYYIALTKDSSSPNVAQLTEDDMHRLNYNNKTLKFEDIKFASLYERNLSYMCIIEENSEGEKQVIAYGEELERIEEPKYFDAFASTDFSYIGAQISMNFAHCENLRKEQVKVGKVTDKNILKKLSNSDKSGWEDLMEYAKVATAPIYSDTVDMDDLGWFSTKQDLIGKDKIEDGQYYYLYVKTDDENGKYISNEAVTISKASKYDNGSYFMFFYGSENFTWEEFSEEINDGGGTSKTKDDTTSPLILPKTGIAAIAAIILLTLISTGAISYYKIKKYKGIN